MSGDWQNIPSRRIFYQNLYKCNAWNHASWQVFEECLAKVLYRDIPSSVTIQRMEGACHSERLED